MTEVGIQFGTPATPDQIERVKKLAQEKGFDEEAIIRITSFLSGGGRGGQGGGGGGGGWRNAGGGGQNVVTTRTLYRLVNGKTIEPVSARLGITDGVNTELVDGLKEDDAIITSVAIPGASSAQGPSQNPFQQRGFGPGGGGFGGGGGRR